MNDKLLLIVGGILLSIIGIWLVLFPPKISIKGKVVKNIYVSSIPYKTYVSLQKGQVVLISISKEYINHIIKVNATNSNVYLVKIVKSKNNIIEANIIKSSSITGSLVFRYTNTSYKVVIVPLKNGTVKISVELY